MLLGFRENVYISSGENFEKLEVVNSHVGAAMKDITVLEVSKKSVTCKPVTERYSC